MKLKLLDLFCGAGGAGMGYYRAGYDVTGVDLYPQPNYPFKFIRADALCYALLFGKHYDVIHASPPCQAYSVTRNLHNKKHVSFVNITRALLQFISKPFVIENVPGAPLVNPITLCGVMFDLKVYRHRLFECEPGLLFAPYHQQHNDNLAENNQISKNGFVSVVGHFSNLEYCKKAMGIDWMNRKELAQAIPPAYTEWIGNQLKGSIK